MSVIAVGNFDGVHRGHVRILETAVALACQQKTEALALTFRNHPRNFFAPGSVQLLTTPEERESLILQQGIDRVVWVDFDEDFANQSGADFLRSLAENYGCTQLVCGENFRFGKNASASACDGDFCVTVPMEEGVSSTLIRKALLEGDVTLAATLLGRPYGICETVISGKHIGTTIGFPTLNQVVCAQRVLPKEGVYATAVTLDGVEYPAITNIGRRPTVEACGDIVVETHVVDHRENLYGKQVRVDYLARMRGERPFPSLDALCAQLQQDVEQSRQIYEIYVNKV